MLVEGQSLTTSTDSDTSARWAQVRPVQVGSLTNAWMTCNCWGNPKSQ